MAPSAAVQERCLAVGRVVTTDRVVKERLNTACHVGQAGRVVKEGERSIGVAAVVLVKVQAPLAVLDAFGVA